MACGHGDVLMVEVVLVVTSGGRTDFKSCDLGMMLVIFQIVAEWGCRRLCRPLW